MAVFWYTSKQACLQKSIKLNDLPKDAQGIAMELNVANKKCVIFSLPRPPKKITFLVRMNIRRA